MNKIHTCIGSVGNKHCITEPQEKKTHCCIIIEELARIRKAMKLISSCLIYDEEIEKKINSLLE